MRIKIKPNLTNGFTLIELAIALFIITVLLAGVLSSVSKQVEIRRVAETKKQLEEIREALMGFAIQNQRLPRPAASITDGTEKTSCLLETDCVGFIPWATLGVARVDSFDKMIKYAVARKFAIDGFKFDAKPVAPTGLITVYDGSQTARRPVASAVAAVLLSHGPRSFGTSIDGVALPNLGSGNLDELANNANNASPSVISFVSRTPSPSDYKDVGGTVTGEFDDIVVWLASPTIVARLTQAGRIP
jgi:prepilin-type N-terminal cleavage/methylation domain-containing protein